MKDGMENIQALIDILKNSNLTEINYEESDIKITLKKPLFETKKETKEESKQSNQNKEIIKEVRSYNIGKFYYHDVQGHPVIEVGKKIKAGQEIGYISTVGVKTPVKSNYTGTIKSITLGNGEIADYGKTLLKLIVESK